MDWIAWIILGAVAGWGAAFITGNAKKTGLITNILIGIVGSVVGGYVMSLFGKRGVYGLNIHSILVALIGGVILLFIFNRIKK